LLSTGEAPPIYPLQNISKISCSMPGVLARYLAAVLATRSNIPRGVSPALRYPRDKVSIASWDIQEGTWASDIVRLLSSILYMKKIKLSSLVVKLLLTNYKLFFR
jgi:hypothetical protein